jgi:hypothetical protein
MFPQLAKRVANILPTRLELERDYLLALFFNVHVISKFPLSGIPCRFRRQSIRLEVVCPLVAVERHFFREIFIESFPSDEELDFSEEELDFSEDEEKRIHRVCPEAVNAKAVSSSFCVCS